MDIAMQRIAAASAEGAALRTAFFAAQAETLARAARLSALALACGNKILLCGNGGSAALAQHMAAEFVNRFIMDRPALPALALSADATSLTAIGSDLDFSQIFSRQVEALGRPGDMLLAITASGYTANIIAALEAARRGALLAVSLCSTESDMASHCDMAMPAPTPSTSATTNRHFTSENVLVRVVIQACSHACGPSPPSKPAIVGV